MANIVTALDLNLNPATAENNSLVFAKNIRLDNDGTIHGDYNFKQILSSGKVLSEVSNIASILIRIYTNGRLYNKSTITTEDRRYYYSIINKDNNNIFNPADRFYTYNIISTIGVGDGVYVFLYCEVLNKSVILKYVESEDLYYICDCNWNWSKGKLDGKEVKTNNDNVILILTEYDADINVPIKCINFNRSSWKDNETIYTQLPEIPFVQLEYNTSFNYSVPNGVYQFFVRYKIDEDIYTNWFPASKDIFIGNSEHLNTFLGTVQRINVHKDSDYSVVFKVSKQSSGIYKSFQIGFICSHDDSIVARVWKHFDINVKKINFDYSFKDAQEIEVTDLTVPNFQLYNVKSIELFNNKIYCANYTETNFNENINIDYYKGGDIQLAVVNLIQADNGNAGNNEDENIDNDNDNSNPQRISRVIADSVEDKAKYNDNIELVKNEQGLWDTYNWTNKSTGDIITYSVNKKNDNIDNELQDNDKDLTRILIRSLKDNDAEGNTIFDKLSTYRPETKFTWNRYDALESYADEFWRKVKLTSSSRFNSLNVSNNTYSLGDEFLNIGVEVKNNVSEELIKNKIQQFLASQWDSIYTYTTTPDANNFIESYNPFRNYCKFDYIKVRDKDNPSNLMLCPVYGFIEEITFSNEVVKNIFDDNTIEDNNTSTNNNIGGAGTNKYRAINICHTIDNKPTNSYSKHNVPLRWLYSYNTSYSVNELENIKYIDTIEDRVNVDNTKDIKYVFANNNSDIVDMSTSEVDVVKHNGLSIQYKYRASIKYSLRYIAELANGDKTLKYVESGQNLYYNNEYIRAYNPCEGFVVNVVENRTFDEGWTFLHIPLLDNVEGTDKFCYSHPLDLVDANNNEMYFSQLYADVQLNYIFKYTNTIFPTYNPIYTKNTLLYNTNQTLIPGQEYNFYIHFVKKTGEHTNGYLYNEEPISYNLYDILEDFNQEIGDTNYNPKIIYPIFPALIKLPDGYVGYFFSIYHVGMDVSCFAKYRDWNYYSLDKNIGKTGLSDKITFAGNGYLGTYYDSGQEEGFGDIGLYHLEHGNLDDTYSVNYIYHKNEVWHNCDDKQLKRCTPCIIGLGNEYKDYLNMNLYGYINPVYLLNEERTKDYYISAGDVYKWEYNDVINKHKLNEVTFVKKPSDPYIDVSITTDNIKYIYSNNYLSFLENNDISNKIKTFKKVHFDNENNEITDAKWSENLTLLNSLTLSFAYTVPSMYNNVTRKTYLEYDDTDTISEYNSTIRSSVFIDDSVKYFNLKFNAEEVYTVPIDKGDIVNLIASGIALLVHTKYSLYKFTGGQSIQATTGEIQLSESDIFQTGVQEVFGSKYGYGGISEKHHQVITEQSYIFFEKLTNNFYSFKDNNAKVLLNSPIATLLRNLKIKDVHFANDAYNNRIFICIETEDNNYLTLSYWQVNTPNNIDNTTDKKSSFISIHDFKFNNAIFTKNKCYFILNDTDNNITNIAYIDSLENETTINNYLGFTNNYPIFPYKCLSNNTSPYSIIDVIVNSDYEVVKLLNSISWCSKFITSEYKSVSDDTDLSLIKMAEPAETKGNVAAIMVYSDTCCSDLVEFKNDNVNDYASNNISLADPNSYKLPRYNKGKWTWNYFRNIEGLSGNVGTSQDIYNSNNSLICGKYFVVRFFFNSAFKLETLSLNYNNEM